MMRKILKLYFNEYALSNNIIQEGHDKAKVDLFSNPEKMLYTPTQL
jgi:hypothetical protein